MNTQLLTAALHYAEQGIPTFLLGNSKRPVRNCDRCRDAGDQHDREACDCLLCHAAYAATTDPDRIRAMAAAVPAGLLAIRTGAASGRVVIDIDFRNNGSLDRALMTRTATVDTTRGLHLHYQHTGPDIPNSASRIAPGVDVRGTGGYAIVPPSIHPRTRRPYQWVGGHPLSEMPGALVKACLPPEPAVAETTTTRTTTTKAGAGITKASALLAAHLDAVARAPEGRRRATLYGAARGVGRMVVAGAVSRQDAVQVLTDAGRAAGQTAREIRAAIAGGFKDEGVTA